MTLHPQHEFSIPEETARVARAVYPKGNLYMKMRDTLGTIYQDESFAYLFPQNGRPVEAPWRLAFITVVQFLEELPDRQAADAVRGRIDLKYALGLELADPGFDFTILSDFRARLVQGEAEQALLDAMLALFKEHGWLKPRQQQRTDSTHILAKIRAINRLMCVGEAMRFALNSLAVVAGDWLLAHCEAEWLYRYGHRIEESRLPSSRTERQELAETIGRDGALLLEALFDPSTPPWLQEVPAIKLLRSIWVQNYWYEDGQLRWRSVENIPPSALYIGSPYDREARYSKKRSTTWVGYKVHLTETCEKDTPHLITHVATMPATRADEAMVEPIHKDLEQDHLLPSQHFLDSGYITAQTLVTSQKDYAIEVIGPTRADYKWQASVFQGFDASHFVIDWEAKHATCPHGHTSISWTPAFDNRNHEVIKIRFSTKDCQICPSQMQCTHSQSRAPRRLLTVRPQEQYQALQEARKRQSTKTFTKEYAIRSGIEATMSQGVRAFGMRRSRYIGLAKTHLQHVGIAAAINLVRVVAWLDGDELAPTRLSAFQRLCYAA
ncbi:MAG TPA: IS1182 family transposase [Ktedonobacteraceae bacterium]|jgi:transposase